MDEAVAGLPIFYSAQAKGQGPSLFSTVSQVATRMCKYENKRKSCNGRQREI